MSEPLPPCVLVVEDNPDHAELVIAALDEHPGGLLIERAADGEEALRYLRASVGSTEGDTAHRPALVLLDLRLPKVDGIEVLRQMREDDQLRQVPVVVLTSSSASRDMNQAYSHHCNSYLVKPLGYGELTELMGWVRHYWTECNKTPREP
ncbi:MAG: response regulator [Armatimonadetes bacterium]|nr:response regulator [Armatimonadota bacterium]